MATSSGTVCALIPAAGRGVRFGGPDNKVFAPLLGRPLLGWALQAFADCPKINDIFLIGSEDDIPRLREIGEQYGGRKVRDIVLGGTDRQASVRSGLAACPDAEYVIVHDAARPFVSPNLIETTLWFAQRSGAATAARPIADTLARLRVEEATDDEDSGDEQDQISYLNPGNLGEIVPRDDMFTIQTPQAFRAALLREAHKQAQEDGFQGTDDAGLVHRLGAVVTLVPGTPAPKITTPMDVLINEALLKKYYPSRVPVQVAPFAVGHGYDVHAFADNRPLFLGGVHFPDAPRGLLGHSDADVLLHALCDALLGAAGLPDIGKWFPPSELRHKNRASIEFLQEVKTKLDTEGWAVGNVDMTVLAETPKIGPRADAIKDKIAVVLGIAPAQIGLKATTSEGLGFIGRSEGIAAHATVLLFRS